MPASLKIFDNVQPCFSLSILSVLLDAKMGCHCVLVLSVAVGADDWAACVLPATALLFFCADGLAVLAGVGGGSLL